MELVARAIENTYSFMAPSCHAHGSALNYPCEYTHSQVQLYVVDRSTGEVLKTNYMSADTFYCFHHINAYEDEGNVA